MWWVVGRHGALQSSWELARPRYSAQNPGKILAGRSLLAAAAVPLAAPSQPHANVGETKAGAAAGRGLRRGCWRNGTVPSGCFPHRICWGQARGPWAQPAPWQSLAEVFALPIASSLCSFLELRALFLKTSVLSLSVPLCRYKLRSTGFQNETSFYHSHKIIIVQAK